MLRLGTHVRRSPGRFARTCDHSDSEWSGILSQRVNPTCSVFGWKSGPHRKILSISVSAHQTTSYWQLERKTSPYISVSLYERSVMISMFRNDFWLWVAIVLQDYRSVYVSTRKTQWRKFLRRILNQQPIVLPFLFPDPVSDKDLGVIYISPIPRCFTWRYWQYSGSYPNGCNSNFAFWDWMFHIGEKGLKPSRKLVCRCHLTIYQVPSCCSLKFCSYRNFDEFCCYCGLSILFNIILYVTLRQTFSNYQKQVVDLVGRSEVIAQGKKAESIPLKKTELLLIAEATNDMLDRLEKNIHDIYRPSTYRELQSKRCKYAALQAQINPHFMYNTLSFTDVCRHAKSRMNSRYYL